MRYPHTVTIVQAATTTDRYGNTSQDWGTAVRTASPAWVQSRSTSEENGNRRAVLEDLMAFLPPTTKVTAHDRMEWDGRTYEVDGEPARFYNLAGLHHLEVPLAVVEG